MRVPLCCVAYWIKPFIGRAIACVTLNNLVRWQSTTDCFIPEQFVEEVCDILVEDRDDNDSAGVCVLLHFGVLKILRLSF